MAGQSKDIGIGNDWGGGPISIGGPLGGPGREGKRLETPQQDTGDYTGPGVPTDPFRKAVGQKGSMRQPTGNPKNNSGTM